MFNFGKKRQQKKERILFEEIKKDKQREAEKEERIIQECIEIETAPKKNGVCDKYKVAWYWELDNDKNSGVLNPKRLVYWARLNDVSHYKYKCKIQEFEYDPYKDPIFYKNRIPGINREGVFFFDDPKLLDKFLKNPYNEAQIGDRLVSSFIRSKFMYFAERKERGSTYTGITFEDNISDDDFAIDAEHLDDYFYEDNYVISKNTGVRYHSNNVKQLVEKFKKDGYVYEMFRWYPYEEAEEIFKQHLINKPNIYYDMLKEYPPLVKGIQLKEQDIIEDKEDKE